MDGSETTDSADSSGGPPMGQPVTIADGLFYTADADGVLRSSPDGTRWTVEDMAFGTPWAAIEDGAIVPCEQTAPAEFLTKRLRGGSPIERAEPGSERWTNVFEVTDDNDVFQANRFVFAEG